MKCSICGAEASYVVALDSRISRILSHVTDKYAARCKHSKTRMIKCNILASNSSGIHAFTDWGASIIPFSIKIKRIIYPEE